MKIEGYTLELEEDTRNFVAAVGQRFSEVRKAAGVSIEELALKVGVSRSHLWRVENHSTQVSIAILYKVARGLGIPPKDLLDV